MVAEGNKTLASTWLAARERSPHLSLSRPACAPSKGDRPAFLSLPEAFISINRVRVAGTACTYMYCTYCTCKDIQNNINTIVSLPLGCSHRMSICKYLHFHPRTHMYHTTSCVSYNVTMTTYMYIH